MTQIIREVLGTEYVRPHADFFRLIREKVSVQGQVPASINSEEYLWTRGYG